MLIHVRMGCAAPCLSLLALVPCVHLRLPHHATLPPPLANLSLRPALIFISTIVATSSAPSRSSTNPRAVAISCRAGAWRLFNDTWAGGESSLQLRAGGSLEWSLGQAPPGFAQVIGRQCRGPAAVPERRHGPTCTVCSACISASCAHPLQCSPNSHFCETDSSP